SRAGHEVRIWARADDIVDSINRERVNPRYLTDSRIPDAVSATTKFANALSGAEFVILAAPSHVTREVLKIMRPLLSHDTILISATKGIESDTGKRISQIVAEELSHEIASRFVCLSGPSFAREVVAGHPTAIVAASLNAQSRNEVQSQLSFDNLRI